MSRDERSRVNSVPVARPAFAVPRDRENRLCSWHTGPVRPAQRPNQVVGPANPEWDRGVASAVHMVEVWSQLGIVAPDPAQAGMYRETERTLPEPP